MHKVITINLNGSAFQLDEDGYDSLRTYLAHAARQLERNPDAPEIIRDLEQSIAEKCQRSLGPGKTVVTSGEIEQILREVGPVENGGPADSPQGTTGPQPRRLYQIREGAMVSGVANGLAAYFNLDPTIVRIVWVVAAVFEATNYDRPPALAIGLYFLLVFLVPYAKTPEERAAAQGASTTLPYRMQHAVERMKAWIGVRGEGRAVR